MKSVGKTIFVAIALISLLFVSCTDNPDVVYKINFMSCDQEDTDKSGFIDEKGQFYDLSVEVDDCTPVINGFCLINGTLYKVGRNISDTIPVIRELESAGIMNDGLIPVCKENDHIAVVDEHGNEVFKLKEFDGKEVLASFSYSDGKLRVLLSDETYVYVDKEGNQLFDKRYKWATDYKRGHAVAQTVNQNSDLYSLINSDGSTSFTFESQDKDNIVISHAMELLSAKENDKMVIYDFSGKRILECPAKVEEIYAFCRDGFIYSDEDDNMGLMTYEGEHLIRARYEQLVPHGKNYLALTDDDEIRLVDKKDKIIKELDGKEILDFQHEGYDFPHLIEMKNHNYMVLDTDGNVLIEDIDIDYTKSGIEYLSAIRSDYFPEDKVLSTVLDLCGNGKGVSRKYGAFFGDSHCTPSNITFLSSSFTKKDLEDKSWARITIENGINYALNYCVIFDSSIVHQGANEFCPNAWLNSVGLHIYMPDWAHNQAFLNKCVKALLDNGCEVYYNKNTDYILKANTSGQLYVIYHNWENLKYEFRILMVPDTDDNRSSYRSFINNIKYS